MYRAGTFIRTRKNSDSFESPAITPSSSYTGTANMPDFQSFSKTFKEQLKIAKNDMPRGLMREMMETYKPHILTRRRSLDYPFLPTSVSLTIKF